MAVRALAPLFLPRSRFVVGKSAERQQPAAGSAEALAMYRDVDRNILWSLALRRCSTAAIRRFLADWWPPPIDAA